MPMREWYKSLIAAKRHWSPALVVLAYFSGSIPAIADYGQAKQHFDGLEVDTRIEMTLGLIATGDFDGLLNFGFTKRYYDAVTSFERREGLVVDGELNASEYTILNSRANEFYGPMGLRYYYHPTAQSKLFVPRRMFESEFRTSHGMSFERSDENLSLGFVY